MYFSRFLIAATAVSVGGLVQAYEKLPLYETLPEWTLVWTDVDHKKGVIQGAGFLDLRRTIIGPSYANDTTNAVYRIGRFGYGLALIDLLARQENRSDDK